MKFLKIYGAKKYAYYKYMKNEKIQKLIKDGLNPNIIQKGKEKSLVLEITVAGVPKIRC